MSEPANDCSWCGEEHPAAIRCSDAEAEARAQSVLMRGAQGESFLERDGKTMFVVGKQGERIVYGVVN